MTLGNYLKELQADDKQYKIAVEIGITESHFCRLVNDQRMPGLEVVKRISKYTGRTIDDLVNTYGL
jgi:transcriptional regulator with XRE-family HTH domain